MSREYTLVQVLGIWLIFASMLPFIISFYYILTLIGTPLELYNIDYLRSFILISPFILVILGWGLYKNHPVARIGMISYLLLTLIVSLGSYFLSGVFLDGGTITLIVLLLGGLILSDSRIASVKGSNQSLVFPSETDDPK